MRGVMRIPTKWVVLGGMVVFLSLLTVLYSAAPYILATYQYERLVAERPSSRAQLEGMLFLYSAERIEITNSLWGTNIVLEPGEYCWQYKILWREPIDVIYDSSDNVKYILPSFE